MKRMSFVSQRLLICLGLSLVVTFIMTTKSEFSMSSSRSSQLTSTLPFEVCDPYDSNYELISVNISSCSSGPCQMQIGQNVTLTAEFLRYGTLSQKLTHEPYWVLNSVNIRATVSPEACEGSLCPTVGAEGFLFTVNILVNSTLPTLRGSLSWKLNDEFGTRVMCYIVPIQLIA